ncbi:MAG: NADH-quinone oxidoreductase subunit M [Alicyclobacillaceae bacterium]|nr:NADH-quinone oxidoreductase subunit M [Alicyclobacillaceae bacterium]
MQTALLWVVLVPLVAGLVSWIAPRDSKSLPRAVALVGSLIAAVLVAVVYCRYDRAAGGLQFHFARPWFTVGDALADTPLQITFALGADGLSLPLLALTAVVGFAAVWASKGIQHRVKEYYGWLMILLAGLYGVFASTDLFVLFFFLEMTLIPTYFLIGIWGGPQRSRAAMKFLLYRGLSSIGIVVAFFGIAYLVGKAGGGMTLDLPALTQQLHGGASAVGLAPMAAGFFLLLLAAILVEEALVPFHTWLPFAQEQAPAPVNMVLGGVLVKTGAYLFLRVGAGLMPAMVERYATLVAVLGVINILWAGLIAFVQNDWRRLLAYTTISHMGVFLLAAASLTPQGLQGGLFIVVSSGLLTALLFAGVGVIHERAGTVNMAALGGLSKPMPYLSGFLLAGALGSLGLPGMGQFVGEVLSFSGSFSAFPKLSALGILGILLAAVYLLWAMQRTTFGPAPATKDGLRDGTPSEVMPMALLLIAAIGVGVFPAVIGHVANGTLAALAARIGG